MFFKALPPPLGLKHPGSDKVMHFMYNKLNNRSQGSLVFEIKHSGSSYLCVVDVVLIVYCVI